MATPSSRLRRKLSLPASGIARVHRVVIADRSRQRRPQGRCKRPTPALVLLLSPLAAPARGQRTEFGTEMTYSTRSGQCTTRGSPFCDAGDVRMSKSVRDPSQDIAEGRLPLVEVVISAKICSLPSSVVIHSYSDLTIMIYDAPLPTHQSPTASMICSRYIAQSPSCTSSMSTTSIPLATQLSTTPSRTSIPPP